jgi:hypothetical protein
MSSLTTFGQVDKTSALYKTIKEKDSLLFNLGFNNCDIKQFENLVSENFKFYHDQSGITNSKAEFISGIKSGLCQLAYKPKRLNCSKMAFINFVHGTIKGAIA